MCPDPGLTDSYVSVFAARTRRPCEERALVLKAMDIEHRVAELPDGCHLFVPEAFVRRARRELQLYEAENPARRPEPEAPPDPRRGVRGAAVYLLVLLLMYLVQVNYLAAIDWLSAGEAVGGRMLAGEWWRAVTALTLHGDPGHVVGNAVFGAFFIYLAGQYLGSGVAGLGMLVGGAVGNLGNAWLQLPGHRSIGASTAVFAILGLVAVHGWLRRSGRAIGWARRAAPLVVAVALLTYLGTGDEHTDIVAHLTGFAAGALIGFVLGVFKAPHPRSFAFQALTGAAALSALTLCWAMAVLNT